jgi:hypothetical protein
MNKVYTLAPKESWIVDRFKQEWDIDNSDVSVNNPDGADIIWLFADWAWTQLPLELLQRKKVVTTIHHLVCEKFGEKELRDFQARDKITDIYHVPNEHTEHLVRTITQKPIVLIPYWANQKIWRITDSKINLRKKYNISVNSFVCGSFQRDTEGSDLVSPKLEKGPDLLCDFLEKIHENNELHVVLAGWRRQYITSRLRTAGISYSYFELPSQEIINELYQVLDLYPIASRYEGGPQSLIEAGLLEVPVVSRNIGMAQQLLSYHSINDDILKATPSIPCVKHLTLPYGYERYRKLFKSL